MAKSCKDCIHSGVCVLCQLDETCLAFKNKDDVVEVVRCKDCKHATFYSCKVDACYKAIICGCGIFTDSEDFFCAYGERKEATPC